jgi:flagellar motor protein MotB
MRSIGRKRRDEDEEESVFVPMTDMTVSFLFIVMILLAFFAVQFTDEDNVPRSVYEEVVLERNGLIEEVKRLNIEIDKLETVIKKLELENSNLTNQNTELTAENSRLDREINFANRRIFELEEEVALLLEDLAQATQKIKDLNLENKNLSDQIQELNEEINDLLNIINRKDKLLEIKDGIIINLRQIIDNLKDEISEKDQEISKLERQIKALMARLKDDPLEAYLIESQFRRSTILSEIERKLRIEFPDILVEVSPENDALRFKGDGLFTSGSSQLSFSKRKIVEKVGALVTDAIECFTINLKAPDYKSCNPTGILIEAIQIEGHTDNSRFVGADGRDRNIELSAKRATSAFFAMKDAKPNLLSYQNLKGQPVISIAGYGDMRPVNIDPKMKAENRRIDLRLIMFTPISRGQINIIQQRIESDLEILLEEVK